MTTLQKPAPRPISAEDRARRAREAAAERRPVLIGVVGTIVLHLLLFWVAQYLKPSLSAEAAAAAVEEARRAAAEKEIAIGMDQELPDDLKRFVEANPLSPDEEPEKTINFGAKNTKAGQPDPGNDDTDRAKTEGKLDQSSAVVTGQRAPEIAAPEPGNGAPNPQNSEMQANVQTTDPRVAQQQTPLPGLEKIVGEDPDGVGTNLGKNPENAKDLEKPVDGKKDGDPNQANQPQVAVNGTVSAMPSGMPGRPGPRPRPRVQQARPAVLANQPLSSRNRAQVAGVDCKLNAFGDYIQRLIEAVDARWNEILDNSKIRPPTPSRVQIKFKLFKDGTVQVIDVEEDAGLQGTLFCRDAITTPAPYEKWTPEMIAFLGAEEDEITFTFFYY